MYPLVRSCQVLPKQRLAASALQKKYTALMAEETPAPPPSPPPFDFECLVLFEVIDLYNLPVELLLTLRVLEDSF